MISTVFFLGIEISFEKKKNLQQMHRRQSRFGHGTKISKGRLSVQSRWIYATTRIGRDSRKLVKPFMKSIYL